MDADMATLRKQPTETEEAMPQPEAENAHKGYVQTVTLATLFGYFGVDRFYLDKVATGILKLVTFGGLGVWVLIDAICAILGRARQKGNSAPLYDTYKYKGFFSKVFLLWAALYLVIFVTTAVFWAAMTPLILREVKKQEFCAVVSQTKQCKTVEQWMHEYQQLKQDTTTTQNLQNNPDIQQFLQDNPSVKQYLQTN